MGGKKPNVSKALKNLEGSPPRGRGKVTNKPIDIPESGITPAWAGKSPLFILGFRWCWDHPRVGGEKSWQDFVSSKMRGSPPRGRGKD